MIDITTCKSIVISRFGGIGDIVMLTPLLRGIKSLFPEIKLILVTDPISTTIAGKFPFVDEVYGFDKSLKSSKRLIQKLWKADFVYLMDTLYRPSVIYWLARIKHRVGIPHKRGKWLTQVIAPEEWMNYAFEPYVYAMFFKNITGVDITKQDRWDDFFYPEISDEDKVRLEKIKHENNIKEYIVCSLETGTYQKDWLLEYWIQLFKALKERKKQVIIIGERGKRFTKCKFPDNVIDFRGKTNLLEVGYLIQRAELLINGCSLPVHIANAMNTPVIGLYGSQPDYRAMPQRIYKSLHSRAKCAPCDFLFKGGHCENPFCMESITPEIVIREVDNFYREGRPLGERNVKYGFCSEKKIE